MYSLKGKYFDGKSSRPFDIDMSVDETHGIFTFSLPNMADVIWHIDDIEYENVGSYFELRNKKHEFIKIHDEGFKPVLFHLLKSRNKLTFYQKLINSGTKGYIAIAVLIVGLIVAGYFIAIPWIAEKAVTLIPESFDRKMGDSFLNTYYEENDIDSLKSEQLNRFASKFDWDNTTKLHFIVVNSETINAFALPNGNIVIFTGLLDKMKGYDELVGLIGHEVSHINHRHSMKMLCRNLAGYIFISAVFSDVNGIMTIISQNMHNLESLTYSRRFEREADAEGTKLIIQNKVDPRGMIRLFSRLSNKTESVVPQFMSTHPYTKERMKYIDEYIKTKKFRISYDKNSEALFNQLVMEK
jgi:beta-barrel assembly-enhancing protease